MEGHNDNDGTEYPFINMTRVYNLSFLYETVNATILLKTTDSDVSHSSSQVTSNNSSDPSNSQQKYHRQISNPYKAKSSTHDPELLKMRADINEGINLLYKKYKVEKQIRQNKEIKRSQSLIRGTEPYYKSLLKLALQGMKSSEKPSFYNEVMKIVNDHEK